MASFAEYAKNKNAKWDVKDDFEKVVDGTYLATFHKASCMQSKKGFWMLSLQYKIQQDLENDGKYVGRLAFGMAMFETAKGWNPWKVKELFETLGLTLPEFEDIEDALDQLVGAGNLLEIEVETKGDFTGVNVISMLEQTLDDLKHQTPDDAEDEVEEAEEDGEYPTEEVLSKMKLADLKKVATDFGIELVGTSLKDIKAELIAAGKDDSEEVESSIEKALESEPEDESEPLDGDEDLEDLRSFCDAQGVSYLSEDNVDTLCEKIEGATFVESELTQDELKLAKEFSLTLKFEGSEKPKARRTRA